MYIYCMSYTGKLRCLFHGTVTVLPVCVQQAVLWNKLAVAIYSNNMFIVGSGSEVG